MGKQASYSDAVPTVKIVLQHTRQIQEGEQRFRNIARIFLENTQGERILCPFNRPGMAQIFARHLAEGGKPNDERWNHIGSLCEEYTKMAGFARAVKNGQFNESAQKLVEAGMNHFINLRESLGKMRGHRGYNAYFESWTPTLMENEGDETTINELFVQETLDPRIESVMPILSKLSKNLSEMQEVSELAEWADGLVEDAIDDANAAKKKMDTPAFMRKQKGGDWKVSQKDLDALPAGTRTTSQGIAAQAKRVGLGEEGVAEGSSAQDKNIAVGDYVQTAAGVEGVVKHITPDGKKLTVWNRRRQADHRVDISKAEKIPGIARRKMAEQDVAEGYSELDNLKAKFEERIKIIIARAEKEGRPLSDHDKRAIAILKGEEKGVAEGSATDTQLAYWDKVAKEKKDKEREALKAKNAEHEKTPVGKAEKYWSKKGVAEGLEDSNIQDAIIDTVERLFRNNDLQDYDSLEAIRQGVKHYFSKPGATAETAIEGILNILDKRMRKNGNYVDLGRFKEALRQGVAHKLKKQGVSEGLGKEQKRVKQFGPTEKITKSNPTRGKLVGADESTENDTDPLNEIKRLMGK
jgi:hypothetical protein